MAVRRDGLGQRLRLILEAMHLADLLGAGYRFAWEGEKVEHHAVPRAADLFQPEYLTAHVLDGPPRNLVTIDRPAESLAALREAAEGTEGWLMHSGTALKSLPSEVRATEPGGYRRLFDRIGFIPPIPDAIAAADRIDLPADAVAIHLRAGDIIYGKFRFTDHFTSKVVCLPVARRMIDTLIAEGRQVVLFSQDPAVSDLIRETPGVTIAADHTAHLESAIEKALFEVVLMSRCDLIYAGNSAFPILAGLIGDRSVRRPNAYFTNAEQARIIGQDLALGRCNADPPLQIAFTAWSAAHLQAWHPAEAIPRLQTAIRHDPVNGFYRLKLAMHHYALGQTPEVEAALQDILTAGPETRQVAAQALAQKLRSGAHVMAADRLILKRAARSSTAAKTLLAEAGVEERAADRKAKRRLQRDGAA